MEMYDKENVKVSINAEITERIKNLEKEIYELSNKTGSAKKPGFFKAIFGRNDFNSQRTKMNEQEVLNKLETEFFKFRFDGVKVAKLSPEILGCLNKIAGLVENEELRTITKEIKTTLRNENKEVREKVKSQAKTLEDIIESDKKLSNATFPYIINKQAQTNTPRLNFKKSIEILKKSKLDELMFEPISLTPIKYEFTEDSIIREIEQNLSNINRDKKETKGIIKNLKDIKEMQITNKKMLATIIAIDNLRISLQSSEIKFEKLEKDISKMKNKYINEQKRIEKELSKYNYSDIKNQLKEINEKKEKERIQNNRNFELEQLAYKLAKATAENKEEVTKIEIEIKEYVAINGIDNETYLNAIKNGQLKYDQETRKMQREVSRTQNIITQEEVIKEQSKRAIFYQAAANCGYNVPNDVYEYVNGDIRTVATGEELMNENIQKEMKKLIEFAELTPQERYNIDLGANAVPEDMQSDQLKSDISNAYADRSYGNWLLAYKKLKKIEEMQKNPNRFMDYEDQSEKHR